MDRASVGSLRSPRWIRGFQRGGIALVKTHEDFCTMNGCCQRISRFRLITIVELVKCACSQCYIVALALVAAAAALLAGFWKYKHYYMDGLEANHGKTCQRDLHYLLSLLLVKGVATGQRWTSSLCHPS